MSHQRGTATFAFISDISIYDRSERAQRVRESRPDIMPGNLPLPLRLRVKRNSRLSPCFVLLFGFLFRFFFSFFQQCRLARSGRSVSCAG